MGPQFKGSIKTNWQNADLAFRGEQLHRQAGPMGSSIQWRAAQWGWRCSPSIFSWGFVFLIFKGKMSRVWSWIWRYCSGFFAASWETIFSSRAEQELSKKNLLTTIGGLGNGESPFRWWIYATLWVAIVHIHFAPRYLSTGVRALDRVPGLGTEHLRPTSRVLVSTAIPTSTSLHQTAGHILCVERSEVWTLKIKVRLLHLSICRIPVKIKVPEPSLQIFYSSSCLSYWWLVEVGGMAHCNRTPSTFDLRPYWLGVSFTSILPKRHRLVWILDHISFDGWL